MRISNCILGLLTCVLRELPENADLVERVIFSSKLNLLALFSNSDDLLRMRMCMLFRLLARFSLRGLQSVWCTELKKAIERLADDDNLEVREVRQILYFAVDFVVILNFSKQIAESTLEELRHFTFYA